MTPEETRAARGCLAGLALCVLSAGLTIGLVAWLDWWLEALSLVGILLVFVALRTDRGPEDPGHVSPGWVRRHHD